MAAKTVWVKCVHLYPNGHLEVGTGAPGYRWSPAYSEAMPNGHSMPMTRRNWYAMARRDGFKCKFHPDEATARKFLSGYHV